MPRRYAVRREIQSRHFYGFFGSRMSKVDVYLTCGHMRTYEIARSPKVGAKIACQTCAPREVR